MSLTSNTRTIEELLEMANNLPKAGEGAAPVIEALSVTENGTYTAPDGVDGYSPVTVNVTVDDRYEEGYSAGYDASQSAITLQEKTVTENGEVTADEGYTGLSKVTVDVPVPDGYIVPSGELEVSENGTHDVTEYASVNVNVATSGGDTTIEDGLITGTLTEYSNDRVTSVVAYAFHTHTKITSINLPAVTTVGDQAFRNMTSLVSANVPNVTKAGGYIFYGDTQLTEVEMPLLKTVGSAVFQGCTALTKADYPLIAILASNFFRECKALTSVNLPAATALGAYAFYNCTALETLDFPVVKNINAYCFYGCTVLKALILRSSDAIATLANISNVFVSTPIASGTGYIYVPSALVDSYKAATNWSTYADQFRALEDYTVDGTTTGELDETKI